MWSLSFLPGTGMGPIVPGPSSDIGVSYTGAGVLDQHHRSVQMFVSRLMRGRWWRVLSARIMWCWVNGGGSDAMVRRGTAQARGVTRARIVLAAADRCS